MSWVDRIHNIEKIQGEMLKELKQIKKRIRTNNVVFRELTRVLRRLVQEYEKKEMKNEN